MLSKESYNKVILYITWTLLMKIEELFYKSFSSSLSHIMELSYFVEKKEKKLSKTVTFILFDKN